MSIYADVVLVINFIMNSILLALTAYAGGISFRWRRLLITAAAGSIYTLIEIFPVMAVLYSIPGKLIASVVMIVLAFGYRSAKITAILTGIFFIVSFIVGGALLGWLYFVQSQMPYGVNHINPSFADLLIGSIIAIGLVVLVVRQLLARMNKYRTLYQTKIVYDGQCQEITGMLDTGNGLYSLLGGKPVVLLALNPVLQMLGTKAAEFLTANSPDTWLTNLDKCQDTAWLSRVEIIPCQSVGGHNMLLGFRADGITVLGKEGLLYTSEILIGICDTIFDKNGDYQALLHPALMSGIKTTGR